MNTDAIIPGTLVMYRPDSAVAGSPHMVLERSLDTLVVKPLFLVLRERFGSFVVPITQVKPARLVHVSNRPQLSLSNRQLLFTLKALDYYAEAGRVGKVELANDELYAVYNARNALADFKKQKGGVNE